MYCINTITGNHRKWIENPTPLNSMNPNIIKQVIKKLINCDVVTENGIISLGNTFSTNVNQNKFNSKHLNKVSKNQHFP